MQSQGLLKHPFKTNLFPEISNETTFKGPGNFILACSVSLLETLVRYSIQPSRKVFFHIKQAFESLQQNVYIYANHYNYYQQIGKFFSIINELTKNNTTIIEMMKSLHFYADNENDKQGLEKGMKMLTSQLFSDNVVIINAILLNNEDDHIEKILARLSAYFKVRFKVLYKGEKKEFAYMEEGIPIIYLRCGFGESAILYAREMVEIESLPNFRYERLERMPFMQDSMASQENLNMKGPPLKLFNAQNVPLVGYMQGAPVNMNQNYIKNPGLSSAIPMQNSNFIKICYFPKCSTFPLYTCSCSRIETGICPEHLMAHFNLNGNHQITNNYKNISEDKKIELKSTLQSKIHTLKENKSKAIRKNQEIIKNLNENLRKYLIMINMLKKKYAKTLRYLGRKNNDSFGNKTDTDTEIFILKSFDNRGSSEDLDCKEYSLGKDIKSALQRQSCLEMIDCMSKVIFENKYSDSKLENKIIRAVECDDELKQLQFLAKFSCVIKPEPLCEFTIPKNFYPNESMRDASPIIQVRNPDILQPQLDYEFPRPSLSQMYSQGSNMSDFSYQKLQSMNSSQMFSSVPQIPLPSNLNNKIISLKSEDKVRDFLLCENENNYVDKDNFFEIFCPRGCSVCTKCRLKSINQCIMCKREYSEYEVQILAVLKIS